MRGKGASRARRPRVHFSNGRPVIESWSGARPAPPPLGRCRVCRRNPARAGGEPCLHCDEQLQRAERLGIYAGHQERRRLGLLGDGAFGRAARWAPALVAAAALCGGTAARAGTLLGRFVLPTTGNGVRNGTLTLALNQAAVVPGSFAIVPQSVACYTSLDGSVVGLPNPAVPPVVHAIAGTGSLPAGTYFIEITYQGDGGESLASAESVAALGAAGEIEVDPPVVQPSGATGYRIYIGAASGTETLQASSGFVSFVQATPLSTGAAPPANNTTACTVEFNDATVPAPTYYVATLTDAAGDSIAGFPQSWYLSGSSVNVSQLIPLTSDPAVRFPSPVLSNPASSAAQSVGSALNLNGFPVQNTSNLGPGMVSGFWSGTIPGPAGILDQWTPNVPIVLHRLSAYAQTAGSGGSSGTTLAVGSAQGTCLFSGMLPGTANSGSNGNPTGFCTFAAGLPLTLSVQSDDHATRPGNVAWILEVTAQ